jgi:3-oxoacyl-[acyl-carrier-protein] synthase-3
MSMFGAKIIGTGSYAPEKVLTNHDLEKMVDTSDEWIQTRTGMIERHIAEDDQATSDLATESARQAMHDAGISPEDLDLIIVGTLSPDRPFPNTACFVQQKLCATNAACFSLEAACTGFLYALECAASMIRTGTFKRALVIGAEKITMHVDWTDRNTCVLFGDGAGAAILEQTSAEDNRYLACTLGADGNYAELLTVPAGGSAKPTTPETLAQGENFIKMEGREVFKLAVNAMVNAANKALDQAGVSSDAIRWLVPHQANTRIIQAVGKKLGMPNERVFINVEKYGNTSAATIPIALDEINRTGQVDKGDLILAVAFGGGLTWGATLIRW